MKLQTKKERVRISCWLSVLIGGIAALLSTRYLGVGEELSAIQKVFFYVYCAGQMFILAGVVNFLSWLVSCIFKSAKAFAFILLLFNSVLLIFIVADTYVYQLYRFHLNWAMIDLFINGGGEVIHFSGEMWMQISLICIVIVAVSLGAQYLSAKAVRFPSWPCVVVLIFCFAVGNFSYAFASAAQRADITWMVEYVPWARPLTMNSLLKKFGWTIDAKQTVDVQEHKTLRYPLNELKFDAVEEKKNIVFVVVDSLRADMLQPEIMPNLWNIAKNNIKFNNHFSSGNSTRAGIFGLFYGIPSAYWHSVLRGNVPSAFISALQQQGYVVEAFASARLTSPEFNKTIFTSVPNVRLSSDGETSWERDVDSICDFEAWLTGVDAPFFSFIFLDNIHGFSLSPDGDRPFKPYWENVNNLELNSETNPTEYFNLYKNAVYDSDKNINKIWDILKNRGLLENTIVVITSDHGEEFNDNGKNFWGHNSNFTDAQIKIPLVVHWAGRQRGEIDYLTTAYDITATLLPEVLGCINDVEDYSIGHTLFSPSNRNWFLSGSYQNNAIVERERITIINGMGMLLFKDRTYGDSPDRERNLNLIEALKLLGKYRK